MPAKKPIIKPFSWLSAIPHLIVLAAFLYLFTRFIANVIDALLLAGAAYLALSVLLHYLFARHQSVGMKLFKKGEYKKAILEFEKSHAFFAKYPFLDKYRYILVLSSSKAAFREIALFNIASCYNRLGRKEKAKEYYQMTFDAYPSGAMLKMAKDRMKSQ